MKVFTSAVTFVRSHEHFVLKQIDVSQPHKGTGTIINFNF